MIKSIYYILSAFLKLLVMTNLFLQGISSDELAKIIESAVTNVLKEADFVKMNESEKLLTRAEAAKLLDVDLSTLHSWVNKGKLKSYGLGSRRYFKMKDILEALILVNP